MKDFKTLTAVPIVASEPVTALPEFVRHQGVFQMFGIRRGKLYQLVADGKIKSVSLRRKGQKTACRLFYVQSIREYLHSLMESAEPDFKERGHS